MFLQVLRFRNLCEYEIVAAAIDGWYGGFFFFLLCSVIRPLGLMRPFI